MEEILKNLHTQFIGTQDLAIQKLSGKRLTYTSIIERKQIELSNLINVLENPGPNFGIANVRIEGEYNNIKFWINRQQYDESFPCDGLNTFYIFENGNCFPFGDNEFSFYYKGPPNCVISYDVVSIEIPVEPLDFLIKINQYHFEDSIKEGIKIVRLAFHHPSEKIIVKSDKPLNDIKFLYCKEPCPHILSFTKINDNEWILDFGNNTLNFTKMEHDHLLINSPTNNSIQIINKSLMISGICDKKYKLYFTS